MTRRNTDSRTLGGYTLVPDSALPKHWSTMSPKEQMQWLSAYETDQRNKRERTGRSRKIVP